MPTLLAAIDNSAACTPVIRTAKVLAPMLGAAVEAVHVAENGFGTAEASAQALDVPFRALRGDPLAQLLEVLADRDVVGTAIGVRGIPGTYRGPGHLAVELADQSDKPLLAVPPETPVPHALRRVLTALEGTSSRPRRLNRALELVNTLGLEVIVVHVDDEDSIPSFSDQIQHETDAYADAFLAQYASGLRRSQLELRMGDPASEILAVAQERNVDLVVMGWPSGAGSGRGTIARSVVQLSPVPTLLVPVG
jgi:nucleotide-binding universal stress UspA family protein